MKGNNQIGAGEFKTHCLKLIDRVNQTKQSITITTFNIQGWATEEVL